MDKAKKVHDGSNLPFDVLSDVGAKVIKDYGLLFREPMRKIDIALPANILIDRDGRIAWQHIAKNVNDRPDPAIVEAAVKRLRSRTSE